MKVFIYGKIVKSYGYGAQLVEESGVTDKL